MDTQIDPVVGNWYQDLGRGEPFQVLALDPSGAIEIAHFDGRVDEIAGEDWPALEIEPCEAPADWEAPFDRQDDDALGVHVSDTTGGDWRAPVEDEPAVLPPGMRTEAPAPEASPEAPVPGTGSETDGAGRLGALRQAELAEARETVADLLGQLALGDHVFELRLRGGAPEVRLEHAVADGWVCVSLPADAASLRGARHDARLRRRLLADWRPLLSR